MGKQVQPVGPCIEAVKYTCKDEQSKEGGYEIISAGLKVEC